MKIAFISTRGIPNNYGGFEQFAEQISVRLAARGHEVIVYSPHYHNYKSSEYKGVRIKHIYSPEQWMGSSVGSFFYDFLSLRDALKKEKTDIVYVAGYTSIIPVYIWYNVRKIKSPVVITNMDGLEYKRTKFNRWVQAFLLWEERMVVKYSHYLIADNAGIQDYYKSKYGKESTLLAYGADVPYGYDERYISESGLKANDYFLLVARMEPENNIKMAIEGYLASKWYGGKPLIIVGNTNTSHGKKLVTGYSEKTSVRFIGEIYDMDRLNSLRHYSFAYFHGHSVGGTNPSLLEAMACGCFILAHDNVFNKAVLGKNAYYYTDERSIALILNSMNETIEEKNVFTVSNLQTIRERYSWEKLAEAYEKYFACSLM